MINVQVIIYSLAITEAEEGNNGEYIKLHVEQSPQEDQFL
jgi:hypothetical protein